jgi:hypothetical protein
MKQQKEPSAAIPVKRRWLDKLHSQCLAGIRRMSNAGASTPAEHGRRGQVVTAQARRTRSAGAIYEANSVRSRSSR